MRYKEYLVRLNNLEKKLGILGESHVYTPDESRFAREIIPNFDTVALEGTSQNSSVLLIQKLYIPARWAYIVGTNRSFNIDSARTIAKKYGKRFVSLEEGIEQLFPVSQKIALASVGAISIFISPFLYGYLKLYGDPSKVGTKAYEKRIAKKKKSKKSLFSRLTDFAIIGNIDERNRVMAERSIDILQKNPGNLLVICGQLHFDGLIKNLYDKLRLEEVRSFP